MYSVPDEIYETSWNLVHESGKKPDDFITFSSNDSKWCKRLLKLKEQYPDDIVITYKNPDGSLVAKIPANFLRMGAPRKSNMSDEQRQAVADRLQAAKNAKATTD